MSIKINFCNFVVTKENEDKINLVANISEKTQKSVNENKAAMYELKEISDNLRDEIKIFKL